MSGIQEEINKLCETVCREYCKHSAEVGGRNMLDASDPNAMDDVEFDKFVEDYCWKCPINDAYME